MATKDHASAVVPIGKYKGQPVEVLGADPQYAEWLVNQGWFAQRYPDLVTVIVNNFTTPSETPEHNALVARFLDDAFALSVVERAVGLTRYAKDRRLDNAYAAVEEAKEIEKRVKQGWCEWPPKALRVAEATAQLQALKAEVVPDCVWKVSHRAFEVGGVDVVLECRIMATWWASVTVSIEVKPSLGDDFPAVLRAMKRWDTTGRRVLVVGQYAGRGATRDQVAAMFGADRIAVVWLEDGLDT
jgi:hypothetical protein